MMDILGLFFLYNFNADWGWWVAFVIVFLIEANCKGKRQEKLDEFLDQASEELKAIKKERKIKEPHIYLGGLDE